MNLWHKNKWAWGTKASVAPYKSLGEFGMLLKIINLVTYSSSSLVLGCAFFFFLIFLFFIATGCPFSPPLLRLLGVRRAVQGRAGHCGAGSCLGLDALSELEASLGSGGCSQSLPSGEPHLAGGYSPAKPSFVFIQEVFSDGGDARSPGGDPSSCKAPAVYTNFLVRVSWKPRSPRSYLHQKKRGRGENPAALINRLVWVWDVVEMSRWKVCRVPHGQRLHLPLFPQVIAI